LKKLISILIFFSLSSYSDAVEEVNRVLKKDLSYQQFTTINDEKKISTGVIKKSDGETIIEVISPYKEKYVINKDKIIVYDFEFNNTSEIEISNIDNLVLDIILYGIDKSKVNIDLIDDKTFKLSLIDHNDIEFKNINPESFSVTFDDNMNIQNYIIFKLIKS